MLPVPGYAFYGDRVKRHVWLETQWRGGSVGTSCSYPLRMPLRYAAAVLLAVLLALPASAQSLARDRAVAYVQANAARHGLSTADVAGLVVTDETVSRRSGVTHVYVRQAIDGVPVAAGAMTVNVARDGRVLLASGGLVPGLALRAARGAAALSPAQAATALARDAGLAPAEPFETTTPAFAPGDRAELTTGGGLTRVPVRAGLVYADDGTGALRLAYETTLHLASGGADWYGLVDAATGRVLERTDLLVRDAFGPAEGGAAEGGPAAPVPRAPVLARRAPVLAVPGPVVSHPGPAAASRLVRVVRVPVALVAAPVAPAVLAPVVAVLAPTASVGPRARRAVLVVVVTSTRCSRTTTRTTRPATHRFPRARSSSSVACQRRSSLRS